jgi:hypothetical protein
MAGRPTSLTPELRVQICQRIAEGLTFVDACRVNHIAEKSFYNWKERGEEGEEPFSEFLQSVKESEGEFKATHIKTIRSASQGKIAGQWQAAAWLLERKYPGEFAMRQQIAVSDKLEQFIKAFDEIK